MADVLVVYASMHGQTRRVAERAAVRAEEAGHAVRLIDLTDAPDQGCPPADLTIVASGVYSNQAHDDVLKWVRAHADTLADRSTALLSVSLAAAIDDGAGEEMCLDYVTEIETLTGWEPGTVAFVAGALKESAYDAATKALLKVAAWRRPLGLEGDHDLTEWDALDRTVDGWLRRL